MFDGGEVIHEAIQYGFDVNRFAHRLNQAIGNKLPIVLAKNRQLA